MGVQSVPIHESRMKFLPVIGLFWFLILTVDGSLDKICTCHRYGASGCFLNPWDFLQFGEKCKCFDTGTTCEGRMVEKLESKEVIEKEEDAPEEIKTERRLDGDQEAFIDSLTGVSARWVLCHTGYCYSETRRACVYCFDKREQIKEEQGDDRALTNDAIEEEDILYTKLTAEVPLVEVKSDEEVANEEISERPRLITGLDKVACRWGWVWSRRRNRCVRKFSG